MRKTQYLAKAGKYKQRKITEEEQVERKKQRIMEPDPLDEMFANDEKVKTKKTK